VLVKSRRPLGRGRLILFETAGAVRRGGDDVARRTNDEF
jgi:hypothetical protein